MSKDGKFIVLERGRDFTLTALAKYLNDTYGNKKSGQPYTPIDIQKYVTRGHLPLHLGGYVLEDISSEDMGIKMIRISPEVHIKFKTEANDK